MYRISGAGATISPVAPPAGVADWVRKLRAPAYWRAGITGRVKVAVIDTGIDRSHPALAGRIVASASFVPGQAVGDDNGHGTHVAGIISQVAPGAQLIVAKGFTIDGSAEDAWLASAIRWCIAQGAKIINASWGSTEEPAEDTGLHQAIREAVAAGILFVASAGNQGHERLELNTVVWPARWQEPLAVASTWQMIAGSPKSTPAPYSSAGPEVDVAAPGTWIVSCAPGGGWVEMSGTSMAGPVVAGLMALKEERWEHSTGRPATEPELVTLALWDTRDIAGAGRDVLSGVGEVDAVPMAQIRTVTITEGKAAVAWRDDNTRETGEVALPDGVTARIEPPGRFVAPFRGLAEGMGARAISYDDTTRSASAVLDVVLGDEGE